MDRSHDVIEIGQDVVRKIERAVAENVALDAGKKPEVFEFAVELSDHGDLHAQARLIESVRLDRAAAVFGNAQILQAQRLGRRRHLFERVVSVARGSVAMESAAQIFRLDQPGQRPRGSRLEFSAVLPQLRRDVIELERAVEIGFLADDRNRLFPGRDAALRRPVSAARRPYLNWRLAEPVFVQRPAALQGAVSHHDVVLLASGKIIERERIFRRTDHAQVALNSRAQTDARFGWPLRDDGFDQRMSDERSRDLRRRGGRNDEIEIADDLFSPPITAGDANMKRVRESAEIVLQRLGVRRDRAEPKRSDVLRSIFNRAAKFFLRRPSKPR